MTDDEIKLLETQLTDAERNMDVATLHHLLSDRFTGVSMKGHSLDKASFIEAFSGSFKFEALEIEDLNITHFNGFSTVVGRSVFEVEIGGNRIQASARYVDVWVQTGEAVKLVSSSVTPEKKER